MNNCPIRTDSVLWHPDFAKHCESKRRNFQEYENRVVAFQEDIIDKELKKDLVANCLEPTLKRYLDEEDLDQNNVDDITKNVRSFCLFLIRKKLINESGKVNKCNKEKLIKEFQYIRNIIAERCDDEKFYKNLTKTYYRYSREKDIDWQNVVESIVENMDSYVDSKEFKDMAEEVRRRTVPINISSKLRQSPSNELEDTNTSAVFNVTYERI